MKKFWFFDLDGTLADTDGDIRLAWKAALADLGVGCPRFDRDFVAGPPIEEMAKTLLPEIYTDEFGARLRKLFGVKYDTGGFPATREYDGVMDAVRRLKDAGARVFVLTNKRWAGAVALAEKFGWEAVFEKIYAGDMHADDPAVGKMKKPALLAFAMRELGAPADECVMVGDTANDFLAATENGVESVGVAWGYGRPDELALADRTVRTPAEIAPFCGNGPENHI
jgi:phosphoglycolate phosphatase